MGGHVCVCVCVGGGGGAQWPAFEHQSHGDAWEANVSAATLARLMESHIVRHCGGMDMAGPMTSIGTGASRYLKGPVRSPMTS
jgi:succinate dehydrogenase/fumarate reductase flavoprotein subunit